MGWGYGEEIVLTYFVVNEMTVYHRFSSGGKLVMGSQGLRFPYLLQSCNGDHKHYKGRQGAMYFEVGHTV